MTGKDGQIAIHGQHILRTKLAVKINASSSKQPSASSEADKDGSHSQVVAVMGDIRKAGVIKLTIVVEDKGR